MARVPPAEFILGISHTKQPTWRIIPGWSKWLITHGDRKSPKDRVVGPLSKMAFLWLIKGGDPNYTYDTWDDPPRIVGFLRGG